jgi:dienelactone hydrolase
MSSELPSPTGPYKVGRTSFELTDKSRKEVYSPSEGEMRRVVIWTWYPAQPAQGSVIAEYLPGKWVGSDNVYNASFGSAILRCHAFADAPAIQSKFPVLVFSPAGFSPLSYSALVEDLASHGYVVVGINHTYDAPVTVFEDGSVVPVSQRFMEGLNSRSISMQESFGFRSQAANIKLEDIIFVTNELETLQSENPVASHLDIRRIGAFGHSLGGNAALEFCATDSRCRCAVNMDGAIWTNIGIVGTSKPSMLLTAEHPEYRIPCSQLVDAGVFPSIEWCGAERRLLWDGWKRVMETAGPAYGFTIQHSKHVNFVDVQFVALSSDSPFRAVMGDIVPSEMSRLTREYLLAFFNKHVKGMLSRLLDLSTARTGVTPLVF